MQKFWPIFSIEIWFFDTQNTFYLIVRGLTNAFLCPFRLCYSAIRPETETEQQQTVLGKLGILVVGLKWPFSSFQNTYDHNIRSKEDPKKISQPTDRKGGEGETVTVSLTVKYPCFFLRLPLLEEFNPLLPESTLQTTARGPPSFKDSPCIFGANDIRGFWGGSETVLVLVLFMNMKDKYTPIPNVKI